MKHVTFYEKNNNTTFATTPTKRNQEEKQGPGPLNLFSPGLSPIVYHLKQDFDQYSDHQSHDDPADSPSFSSKMHQVESEDEFDYDLDDQPRQMTDNITSTNLSSLDSMKQLDNNVSGKPMEGRSRQDNQSCHNEFPTVLNTRFSDAIDRVSDDDEDDEEEKEDSEDDSKGGLHQKQCDRNVDDIPSLGEENPSMISYLSLIDESRNRSQLSLQESGLSSLESMSLLHNESVDEGKPMDHHKIIEDNYKLKLFHTPNVMLTKTRSTSSTNGRGSGILSEDISTNPKLSTENRENSLQNKSATWRSSHSDVKLSTIDNRSLLRPGAIFTVVLDEHGSPILVPLILQDSSSSYQSNAVTTEAASGAPVLSTRVSQTQATRNVSSSSYTSYSIESKSKSFTYTNSKYWRERLHRRAMTSILTQNSF